MAVTVHFQSTGTVPNNARPTAMGGHSLTIGRGEDNDLVLPDPERMISKHHCAIEDQGGNIVVIDYSTNGTFLNYGKMPLGNVPTPLNDGDILSLGSYELRVDIQSARGADPLADIPPPLEDPQAPAPAGEMPDLLDDAGSEGDFLDDLLGDATPAGPKGVSRPEPGDDGLLPPLGEGEDDLLAPAPEPDAGLGASQEDHAAATEAPFAAPRTAAPNDLIPDDWDEDFLGGEAPPGEPFGAEPEPSAPQPPAPEPSRSEPPIPEPPAAGPPAVEPVIPEPPAAEPPQAAPPQAPPPVQPPAVAPTAAPAPAAGGDAAARAFLKALGAGELPVSDSELEETMTRLGGAMRVMIEGLREVLMTRASIKSEFRINQTMISAGGNNPLKFSVSPEQAVAAMVKPTTPGYLDAAAAATQALDDVKAHEVASMTGMEAALKGVLKRLDPATLEAKLDEGGGLSGMLKGRKARYWELYEKLYAEIADEAENDFHDLFSREFARAYQEQLERLK